MQEKTLIVKPTGDLVIRRPDSKAILSKDGERVPDTTFWRRRLLDGDVEEVKETKKHKQEDVAAEEIEQPKSSKKGGK